MMNMRVAAAIAAFCFVFSAAGQQVDASGRKQGYWKKKDEKTGQLIYEGEFKDDKPVGRFRYYYPNDSVRAVLFFRKDGKSSYARLFHSNGKRMGEGRYAGQEKRDSVWTFYDEAGVLLSRESYLNGQKNGPSFVYFPDGSVNEEKNWKAGIEDGIHRQYFDDKKLKMQNTYINGKLQGRSVYLHPNGTEMASGYYRNGLKNGAWIYRDASGKITEKELFKDGRPASPEETAKFFEKNKVPASKSQAAPATGKPAKK